jgi:probable F420-dependent oxidoreductase
MKFDVTLLSHQLQEMPNYAQTAESIGFDGVWTAETQNDPFLPLVLAAEHSKHLNLGTAIAVAFPRSPATLAYIAWDLARYSQGRFILGLGSQVRGHIERRFGVKWEKPVKKLREMILAIRAYWKCWQHGTRLDFAGEFFKVNLMIPFFNPGPIDHPHIPIFVSAINQQMLRMAGEVCDGVHIHALHTVKYLEEFALPRIQEGMERGGRSRDNFQVNTAVFVVPTDDPQLATQAEAHVRQQLSFYMSTPAYKIVLELHGWGALSQKLGMMARRGEWDDMPKMITDEVMDTCALIGTWAELPGKIHQRYGDLLDRVGYYLPFVPGQHEAGWRSSAAAFKLLRSTSPG